MNTPPERDDALDRLLLGAGVDPVPDHGFSERAMSRLPARRPRPARTVLGLATAIGTALATWQLSGSGLLHATGIELQQGMPGIAVLAVLAAVLTLGIGMAGWAVAEAEA